MVCKGRREVGSKPVGESRAIGARGFRDDQAGPGKEGSKVLVTYACSRIICASSREGGFCGSICKIVAVDAAVGFNLLKKSGEASAGASKKKVADGKEERTMFFLKKREVVKGGGLNEV